MYSQPEGRRELETEGRDFQQERREQKVLACRCRMVCSDLDSDSGVEHSGEWLINPARIHSRVVQQKSE